MEFSRHPTRGLNVISPMLPAPRETAAFYESPAPSCPKSSVRNSSLPVKPGSNHSEGRGRERGREGGRAGVIPGRNKAGSEMETKGMKGTPLLRTPINSMDLVLG